jgi:hypothetical protein
MSGERVERSRGFPLKVAFAPRLRPGFAASVPFRPLVALPCMEAAGDEAVWAQRRLRGDSQQQDEGDAPGAPQEHRGGGSAQGNPRDARYPASVMRFLHRFSSCAGRHGCCDRLKLTGRGDLLAGRGAVARRSRENFKLSLGACPKILPFASTMHTLDCSSDTSIPA